MRPAQTPAFPVPAESASAAQGDAQDAWQLADVKYNGTLVDGVYTVTEGDVFAPTSVTEFGSDTPLSTSEYTVIYVDMSDQVLSGDWTITGKPGDMPKTPYKGLYQIAVVKGYVDKTTLVASAALSTQVGEKPYLTQPFDVIAKSTELKDVAVALASDKDVDEFTYNGDSQTLAFYMNGEKLTTGYTVVWNEGTASVSGGEFAITDAGDYKATLYAEPNSGLSGSCEISFSVAKLDLSTATLTAEDQAASTSDKNVTLDDSGVQLSINGNTIGAGKGVMAPVAYSYKNADGKVENTFSNLNTIGAYTYKVGSDNATDEGGANENNKNVVGEGYVTVNVYTEKVSDFKYSGTAIAENASIGTFTKSLGQSFNPAAITVENSYEGFTFTVENEDGQEFTSDWANLPAGKYNLTITSDPEPKFAKGGSRNCTFEVVESTVNYANAVYFVYVDGKVAESGDDLPYTGKAYVPTVVAKDAASSKVLAEGADFTVTLKDAQNNVVEGFTDVADGYQVCIEFADGTTNPTVLLDVVKAEIEDAKASAEFFAIPADGAAEPAFVGNTMEAFEGQTFDLAGQVSATYFKVKDSGKKDAEGNVIYVKDGAAVDPAKMTEEGTYAADLTILANSETLTGSVSAFGTATDAESASVQNAVVKPGLMFELTKTAGYNDVAADAWYADSVYKAKDNLYMEGVAAGIFAPEKAMTRAEFAQVVANMAGVGKAGIGETYPTQFSDVPADAWYAKAVEWAARYGIVTGTSETTFAPNETISREQIAAMFYRYAGNGAQADLSVLDQFEDADQVSGWAKEAMAWAIEEGYMNGTSETTLAPSETAQRAQIAAIAVRVQPEAL